MREGGGQVAKSSRCPLKLELGRPIEHAESKCSPLLSRIHRNERRGEKSGSVRRKMQKNKGTREEENDEGMEGV